MRVVHPARAVIPNPVASFANGGEGSALIPLRHFERNENPCSLQRSDVQTLFVLLSAFLPPLATRHCLSKKAARKVA